MKFPGKSPKKTYVIPNSSGSKPAPDPFSESLKAYLKVGQMMYTASQTASDTLTPPPAKKGTMTRPKTTEELIEEAKRQLPREPKDE
jgi:hypothetical protein